jgi:hypothetical protein
MNNKEPQRTEFPPRVKTSANGMFAVTEYVSLQEHAAAIAELQDALAMSSKRNAELDARYKKEHYDRVRHWKDLTAANADIAELERKLTIATDALEWISKIYGHDQAAFKAATALDAVRGRG